MLCDSEQLSAHPSTRGEDPQIDYLTSLPAEKLPSAAPYVRYVLLRPIQIFRDDTGKSTYMTYSPKDAQLFADLMLKDLEEVPGTYVCSEQASLRADDDAEAVPYIRLYTVEPGARGRRKMTALTDKSRQNVTNRGIPGVT